MGRRRDASARQGRKSRKRRRPFLRRLLAATPVIIVSILLTLLYSNTAPFRRLETLSLDLAMLVRAPSVSRDVVVVRITDAEYQDQQRFRGKSPLDPSKVAEIIKVIASGRPKVIGVALDTSSEAFQSLEVPADWPPIIWARDATYSNVRRKYLLSPVLGGRNPAPDYGLVTMRVDADGAIRRYSRWYDTDSGAARSLPWAMWRRFRNEVGEEAAARDFEEEFLINYAGPAGSQRFLRPTVSMVEGWSVGEGWQEKNLLRDKMVILAGDYAVEDEHDTPVGWMIAADILATIIETERQGGGYKPLGTAAIVGLSVFDSLVLLVLIHLLGLKRTLLLSALILPAIALIFSLLFFGSVNYVGFFLLVLIAVLLQQVYEQGKEHLKKSREQAADDLK